MDVARPNPLTTADAADRLRAVGRRVTRQRLAAFEALASLGGHRSVDEITASLHARGETIPATSVYNAIDALQATDLVCVAHRGPPRALYELAGRPHDHFECRVCGDIIDVPTTARRPVAPALPGAVVEQTDVTFRGVCAACNPG